MKFPAVKCSTLSIIAAAMFMLQGCDKEEPLRPDEMDKPTIEQMSQRSEVVIVGQVEDSQSRWIGKKIMTTHKIRPLQFMKGEGADTIEVTTYGGEVGNMAQEFSHAVTLEKGEVSLLFLQRVSDQHKLIPRQLVPYPEHGRIMLLRPDQRLSRLQNNNRLRRYLDKVASEVAQGDQS